MSGSNFQKDSTWLLRIFQEKLEPRTMADNGNHSRDSDGGNVSDQGIIPDWFVAQVTEELISPTELSQKHGVSISAILGCW
jgi:hypothetical protein